MRVRQEGVGGRQGEVGVRQEGVGGRQGEVGGMLIRLRTVHK